MAIDKTKLDYCMTQIRPQLQADGGDIEVTRLDDEKGIVYVKLQGACVGCPMSQITLSQGVERVLKEHVDGVERVVPDLDVEGFETTE
ncbi:MAG: NifU family protein [Coriobacteriales bacterium]|nr:NifU family protein [Coriobacteriales bacterium]